MQPRIPGPGAHSEVDSDTRHPVDQMEYLQSLLDKAHAELAEYKHGMIRDAQEPLWRELIAIAQSVETFLWTTRGDQASASQYRSFLEDGVLGDIGQALRRYGVEPFLCSSQSINRRLQQVVRLVDTNDGDEAGTTLTIAQGYATPERVVQKEQVALYRLSEERDAER